MAHICRMHADLVLASRLELELHERMLRRTVHHVEVRHRILPTVIHRRRIGHVGLVVLQPVRNRPLVVHHLTRADGHIPAVIDDIVPVVFEYLLRLHILGIDHQSAGITVQTVHDMRRTLLTRLLEIVIEHGLHVQARVTSRHRQDACLLLHDDEPPVFVHDLHPAALETLLVALRLTHRHLHPRLQREVELAHGLAVHLDAATRQRRLDLRLRLRHILYQPLQQRLLFLHHIVLIVALTVMS